MMCLQMVCFYPPKILDWRREVGELLLPEVSKAGGLHFVKEMKEGERKVKLAALLVGLVLEFVFVQPVAFRSLPYLRLLVFEPFPAFLSYQGSLLESWQISPAAPSLSSWAVEWG